MTIVVMWARFGPYHMARLRGLAAAGVRVVGLEVCRSDAVYDWDPVDGEAAFERVTLFPDRPYEQLSGEEIRAAVSAALDRFAPAAVAINGWSAHEARAAMRWRGRRSDCPLILMSETKQDDAPRAWWRELAKSWIVRRADAALVGGQAQADYLTSLSFPADRIFIGYDAVDNDYFRSGAAAVRADAPKVRRELGLPDRFFFACTRFIARKNLDGLLKGYAAYRAACVEPPWGLVIAGGGEAQQSLAALERSLGLDGVVWPGFVQYDALPAYFGLASAFVHPARSEPWGLVVNEAAASGLPILVSRTVGAGLELLHDGENGFGFDPDSIAGIAEALTRMHRTPETARLAMGARSSVIVQAWGPDRFGAQMLAAIDQVRAGRARPHGGAGAWPERGTIGASAARRGG
jgi:glycosyltransferase involved in cell wall biosynthesis